MEGGGGDGEGVQKVLEGWGANILGEQRTVKIHV